MSQPATAAIIVASIFGGLAALFFGYKAYRKFWTWRHHDQLLPPIRETSSAYHSGTNMSNVAGGRAASVPSQSNRNSFLASPTPQQAWAQSSREGLPSTASSEFASPSICALDSVVVASPSEPYDPRSGVMSSSSSTMTLSRAYLKSSSASQHSYISSPGRRESYLPHSPLNRDTIQIVPPQPLGFGGSMAMAADQKTLTFSKSSGIGLGDDFGSGLVWTQPDTRSRSTVRSQVTDPDRRRYLMQGPSSSLRESDKSSLRSYIAPSQSASQVSSIRMESAESGQQSPIDSRAMTLSTSVSTTQSSETPSVGPIDSKTVDAVQSPLQRLQSGAPGLNSPPHLRSDSTANSLSAESHESPILSPFSQPHSSPFVPSVPSAPAATGSPVHH